MIAYQPIITLAQILNLSKHILKFLFHEEQWTTRLHFLFQLASVTSPCSILQSTMDNEEMGMGEQLSGICAIQLWYTDKITSIDTVPPVRRQGAFHNQCNANSCIHTNRQIPSLLLYNICDLFVHNSLWTECKWCPWQEINTTKHGMWWHL